MNHKISLTILASFLAGFLFSTNQAVAGEGLFSRVYTTETVPQGHFELEQMLRDRSHRAYGNYNSIDARSEFEYGITDNFQVALYVNTGYLSAQGAPDDNDPDGDRGPNLGITRSRLYLQGISTEFIYRVLSPVTDPIGLAFYYEPEWDFYDIHNGDKEFGSMENEARVLIQKNFLGDQLILAYNMIFETEYFRYGAKETPFLGEFDWNNEIGLTYRFAPAWYGGLEARNHNEVGNFWSHDHSVFWAGPAVHYAGQRLWATLGVMRQIYGDPSGPDANGSNQGPSGLFLHSHELWETTFKLGLAF